VTRGRAAVATHPRHTVLFALVAGLLAAPVARPVVLALAVLAAAVCGLAVRGEAHTARRAVLPAAAAVAVLAGGLVAGERLAALHGGALPHLHGGFLEARATVLEPIRERPHGPSVARMRLLEGPAAGEQVAVRLPPGGPAPAAAAAPPVTRPAWPDVGEIVRLRGVVVPLGRFDAHQRRRGAMAALDASTLDRTGARRGGIAGALDTVRRRAERGIEAGLPAPQAALLRGMVLGQDERLTDEVRTDFQRSGLAHVLAVSGQNVMLLAMLVMAVGALTGLALRARLVLVLALIAVYVPLTGAGPSIQRAGVMGAAGIVAVLAGTPATRWYALALAAAVTLALNPLAAGDPGWQLSFAAVVALLALAQPLRRLLSRALPGPVADAAAITIAATVGTAPLMAFHFEYVSLVSLPANLVAAAAIAPAMWLGMLATAVAQVDAALAVPLDVLNAPLVAFVEGVAHAAASAPLAVTTVHLGSPAALALAYAVPAAAAMGLRAAWRRGGGAHGRRVRPRALAAGIAALALGVAGAARAGGTAHPPPPDVLVVSFLDVGQGDATLLQHGGVAVLFDTGPPDGPILARLRQAGVRRLDVLVLTHAEADHEGAALAVLRRHRPRLVLDGGAGWPSAVQRALPAAAGAVRARVVATHAGQSLALGRLRLRFLWPPRRGAGWRPDGSPNLRAVVAVASVGAFDVLLTGDAESDVTLPLALPDVEAMKVAHHGSADDGLPLLLRRTAPAVAAIEVGRHNTYGHPTASALAALRVVPTVVRTDRDGTVRLHVRGSRTTIERLGPGR
jgi:competence protein ComEC